MSISKFDEATKGRPGAKDAMPILEKGKEIAPQRPDLRSRACPTKSDQATVGRADVYYLLAAAFSILRPRLRRTGQKQKNCEAHNVSQFIYYMKKAVELEPTWSHPRMCLIEHLVAAGEDDLAKQQLQELEKYVLANFPVPVDEMELYYEELITGRVMTDYAKKQLQNLRLKLGE